METFLVSALVVAIAEIGDKTQVATVSLSPSFDNATFVVVGTVLGMMVANRPAVLLGTVAIDRVPMPVVRIVAAGLFLVMGVLVLADVDTRFLPPP